MSEIIKPFTVFNTLRNPSDLADEIYATLRVWDISYEAQRIIISDLYAISRVISEPRWDELTAMTPINFGAAKHEKARELFQVLKIWDFSFRQMSQFVGRLKARSDGMDPVTWKAWEPGINREAAILGVSR